MSIQKLMVTLAATAVLAVGALTLAGGGATPLSKLYACGAGGDGAGSGMKSQGAGMKSHSLSASMIAHITGDSLSDKERSAVGIAIKHHQAVVKKANAELLASIGKTVNLDASQKNKLQCAVAMSTGSCDEASCTSGCAGGSGGAGCGGGSCAMASSKSSTSGAQGGCPMSGH
ncbi:MAG: hypothetical protein HY318_13480 [Armatimonadetes bacterium]|nr:hypothetical protein [Armatimonadota bacterium]